MQEEAAAPPRVQVLGSTTLARAAVGFLLDQGRARVVGLDPGDEDESRPWFAPIRQLCRDEGLPIGRAPADLTLDLDPDARPTAGHGVMVRVLAPPGARSPDVNRALLTGGTWEMAVCTADGTAGWARTTVVVRPGDDAAAILADATLRGIEALAESFEALLAGAPAEPLPRPLLAGRWRAQEGHIVWELPGPAVVARIRAASGPWGGARTIAGQTHLTLLDAELVAEVTPEGWAPGTIVALDDGLDVATGRGVVRLRRLRPGWRPDRYAHEWAHEVGLSAGYQIG